MWLFWCECPNNYLFPCKFSKLCCDSGTHADAAQSREREQKKMCTPSHIPMFGLDTDERVFTVYT